MEKQATPTPSRKMLSQEEAWEALCVLVPLRLGGGGGSKALGKEAKADFKSTPAGPSPRKASEHGQEEVGGVVTV